LLVVRSRRTLVEVPTIARPRTAPAQPSRDHRSEFQFDRVVDPAKMVRPYVAVGE
jgi:hypothetical protein